jgi:hypothetical protein
VPEFRPVLPTSTAYCEFARLYQIARHLRPSAVDRWNGELYTRDDAQWGSLHPKTGALRLSSYKVMPYLTGPPGVPDRKAQSQALQAVLHEIYHCRVQDNVPKHIPNAIRTVESRALDEGLTEYMAAGDLPLFADPAGYGELLSAGHEYPGAFEATRQLLEYAAPDPQRRSGVAARALDQPVVMRWDAIADEIVRTRMDGVVPLDPWEQQTARAQLVQAMAHPTWREIEHHHRSAGQIAAHESKRALDEAIRNLHTQYGGRILTAPASPLLPDHTIDLPQAQREPRTSTGARDDQDMQDLRRFISSPERFRDPSRNFRIPMPNDPALREPAPQTGNSPVPLGVDSDVARPTAAQQNSHDQMHPNPAVAAAFSGQAPAIGAVLHAPSVGDGSRGRSSPTSPGRGLDGPGRDDR